MWLKRDLSVLFPAGVLESHVVGVRKSNLLIPPLAMKVSGTTQQLMLEVLLYLGPQQHLFVVVST